MKEYCRIFAFVAMISILLVTGCTPEREKVKLRFSDWHLTENVWEKSMTDAIRKFEEKNPEIQVLIEPVSFADKDNRYIVESEAGVAPDVFHVQCNSLQAYFAKGYARDLTRFVRREGGKRYTSSWLELPMSICRYNGRLMAMPGDYMSIVLFYNKTLFEKAGLDPQRPPVTWPEFIDISKKLTLDSDGNGSIDQWGFTTVGAVDPGFELRFSPFIWSFGGDYLTEDGKHSALNRPETIEGFRFFVELYKKYEVVPPGILKRTPQDTRVQFANQQAAMMFSSGWTIPDIDDINPMLKASEVLEAAPVPSNGKKVTSAWVSAWIMSSTTKHPNEAWKLIRFLTSKDMELKWFRDDGVLSSRKDVNRTPEVLNDKYAQVISSQLPYARLVPQIKEWPEIITVVTKAVQDAINEIKTPEAAVLDAHVQVEKILQRRE